MSSPTKAHLGYTKTNTYDCNSCGHSSSDLDGARSHQAEHVAGPVLLAALREIEEGKKTEYHMREIAKAAIAKAELKG